MSSKTVSYTHLDVYKRQEVSDFAAVAFDSRQATVVRLKQLFNESGSTYTAINRYLRIASVPSFDRIGRWRTIML